MTMLRMSRRQFIRHATGAAAGAALGQALQSAAHAGTSTAARRLIIVVFGGGTRCSESIDDPEHRFIPGLWNEMVPAGTLFTNMRVERTVVHPNSTGSIVSGRWEYEDIDWTRPIEGPSIFEIFRKTLSAADTSTWAFVYASILSQVGYSLDAGYGHAYAGNVVVPPTIPRFAAVQMEREMQQAGSDNRAQLDAARRCAEIARTNSRLSTEGLRSRSAREFIDEEFESWRSGAVDTSHDLFLAERAIACIERFAPRVLLVNFGEIDCAHYGSWSRYVDAIRRTDDLTCRLWRAAQRHEAFRNNTLMLVLPDHGRELDRPGHWGFVHHGDFYTGRDIDEGCRRVWMLAIGAGVRGRVLIDAATPITAVAATGLEFLGLDAPGDMQPSVWSRMG